MRGQIVATRVLRYGIALLLLATSVGKLLDLRGFAGVLSAYDALARPLLFPAAVAITAVELALAAWLISGRRIARAAAASAALHGLYAAGAAWMIGRGLRIDNCGCFGVFFARPLTWATVAEDLVLAGCSVTLSRLARLEPRVA